MTPYAPTRTPVGLHSAVHAPKTPAPVVTTEFLRGRLDARGIDAQFLPIETVWGLAEHFGIIGTTPETSPC